MFFLKSSSSFESDDAPEYHPVPGRNVIGDSRELISSG